MNGRTGGRVCVRVCARKRAAVPYRDARSPAVRRQEGIVRISSAGADAHERACGIELACWMEHPLARGVGGGKQLPHRGANIEAQAPGAHSFSIPLCTDSKSPPTEHQESNTSICQQSFVTRAL